MYELAGALLGTVVVAGLLAFAWARWAWNPAAWNR